MSSAASSNEKWVGVGGVESMEGTSEGQWEQNNTNRERDLRKWAMVGRGMGEEIRGRGDEE
jgi:hypothetical protein